MEKRKVVLSVVLVVWILALLLTFYYLYSVYNDVTSPTTIPAKLNSKYVELYTIPLLGFDQLSVGSYIPVSIGDIIPVSVKNEDYSIKVYDINESDNRVDLTVNNFLFFSLKKSETKKMDFNGDNYYDILITLDDIGNQNATLFIKSINEKRDTADQIGEALSVIQKNSDIQSKVIFLFCLIFIVIIIIYFIKAYLAPAMKLKKRTEREKPESVMDYLYEEFNKLKKSGNYKDATKIVNKAKSLYKHMSGEDKKNFSSKMKSMERYIN